MCGVFFCCFHVCSCVDMCGVCFSMIFLCVFMCGVFFCCFQEAKKKHIILLGGVKFVTNTSPALVTFFSAPTTQKKKRQMMLQMGGVQIC